MIQKKLEHKLNKQINREATASAVYLELASWCENRNLPNVAEYFYRSSEDERQHMLMFYRYVNAQGGHALSGTVEQPEKLFANLLQVFEYVYELEHGVTCAINDLADYCLANKAFSVFQFLQPFITEQEDSERSVSEHIHMIKTLGFDEKNLYFINKYFGKLLLQSPAPPSGN